MIDDQARDYRQWSKELSKRGVAVEATSDIKECLSWIRDGDFDLAIVDLEMPGTDGIEAIRAIHEIDPSMPIVVLSAYHHLDKWKTALDDLAEGISFACMEKPFPPTTSESFDKVVMEPIRELLAEGVHRMRRRPGVTAEAWDEARAQPFEVELESYLTLSLEQKAELQCIARRQLGEKLIEMLDAEKAQWVLICGDPEKPVRISKHRSHMPTDEEKLRIGRRHNRVPYLFQRPVSVEELTFKKWQAVGERDWYPTIGMYFPVEGKKPEENTIALHFDTGSPLTYVSYEKLQRLGAIASGLWPASGVLNLNPQYEYTFFDVTPNAICTDGKATCSIRPLMQAVVNWHLFPIATNYPGRVGLAGRSLLSDCGLTVVLDGKAKRTRLQE